MFSLNRATVLGNCTRDPEMRQTATGQNVCSFGIATNRTWTDAAGAKQEAAEFHNVVAWGKLAEICSQYLAKGRKVYLEGRLQTRSWDDQQTGQKRYATEIVASQMTFVDGAGGAGVGEGGAKSGGAAPAHARVRAPASGAALREPEIFDDEVPF